MLSDHPGHPTIWLVNGPLLLLYALAPTLTYLLCAANDLVGVGATAERRQPPLVIALFALVTQFFAVGTLVAAGNALSTAVRFSMLALPAAMIAERYLAAALRKSGDRAAAAPALGGALAGLALGAALFMRHAVRAEPITTPMVPGSVRTLPISEMLKGGANWAISLDLMLFYGISLAIFFCLHKLLRRTSSRILDVRRQNPWLGTLLALGFAFLLNFLGVVSLLLSANLSSVGIRQAMVFFPLLLVVESYWGLLRDERRNRRAHLTGLLGSASGMAAAVLLLMRGAPLH